MDLAQLKAFVALAELKHFGRAANQLHITQPALTKRLRQLEGRLGVRLFERSRSGTLITTVGEALLPNAMSAIAEADLLMLRARQLAEGSEGRLDIGFGLSTIDVAPRLVAKFKQAYPGVTISLNDFSSEEQTERLQRGKLDVGFLRLPVTTAGIESMRIGSDMLALVHPTGHGLELRANDYRAFREASFVMLNARRGPGLRMQLDGWCEAVGVELKVIQIADDIQTVLALVAAGVGLSILPRQAVRLMGSQVSVLPLHGPASVWTVGAAWRSEHGNPAVANFIKMIAAE